MKEKKKFDELSNDQVFTVVKVVSTCPYVFLIALMLVVLCIFSFVSVQF